MNENTDKIELTTKTAWVLLERMLDWLEWIDRLDDGTRRNVIALDELVRELDAEQFLTDRWYKQQAEMQEANKAHLEAMQAKEGN
jgi:hypothetical protein